MGTAVWLFTTNMREYTAVSGLLQCHFLLGLQSARGSLSGNIAVVFHVIVVEQILKDFGSQDRSPPS